MSDALSRGRKFRVLALVDDFGQECLAPVVDNSLSGIHSARELDRVVPVRGTPCMIVSDNGTELTSRAMRVWQQEHGIEWHYIAAGKPMQNAFIESRRPHTSLDGLTSTEFVARPNQGHNHNGLSL